MPTKTKTTKDTRVEYDAQELFKKGQRIVRGEKPSTVFPQRDLAAAPKPFFFGSQEVIADAVAEMITTGATEENLTLVIQAVIDHNWRRRFHEGVNEGSSVRYAPTYPERETRRILDELAVARTKRTKLEIGERPEPADVVARIRETAREQRRKSTGAP